jgi:hypothetical protein
MRRQAIALAVFLGIASLAKADTILVGSDLVSPPTIAGASSTCISTANCTRLAQQFTLTNASVITEIQVLVFVPKTIGIKFATVSLALTDGLPEGSFYTSPGSVTFAVPSDGTYGRELIQFDDLDISLTSSTYYLVMDGENLGWSQSTALSTSGGTVGSEFSCDPTVSCAAPFWDRSGSLPGAFAFEVDGTIVPEPSSILLLGTGALGLAGVAGRKFRRR